MEKENNNFIYCPICEGRGVGPRGFSCSNCNGVGLGTFFSGKFYYWSLRLGRTVIEL